MWYTMCNEILLSHKKEQIWVICSDVGAASVCHTEWSRSEKQTTHINAYTWNLEKRYRWTYLRGRNRHTDGATWWGVDWQSSSDTDTFSCVKQVTSGGYRMARELSLVICEDLDGQDGEEGGRDVQEGGDTHTHTADSSCYTAENNTAM